MRPLNVAALALLAPFIMGNSGCEPVGNFEGPILGEAPASFYQLCPKPVVIAAKNGLSSKDVMRLWSTDRASLARCYERHRALVTFYRDRDGRLRGKWKS